MQITHYQINTVLKVYTRHLSRDQAAARAVQIRKPGPAASKHAVDDNRLNLIDKITSDIVGKIAHDGSRNESEAGSAEPLRLRYENAPDIRTTPAVHFVYNRIEGEDEKRTHTVALDDYDYFMQRLEASAEEAGAESFDA